MKKTFAYHKPSEQGLEKIRMLREAFSDLYERIEKICPDTYQRATALINLDTASMWAIKAVVCNDPDSTTPESTTPE